jgi:hypothetical protein
MRRIAMRALTASAVVLALGVVGTAAASRLQVRGAERGFRITWTNVEFEAGFGFGGEFAAARCPVTLEGSFHSSTIRKIARALIGYVTRAAVNEGACREFSTETFHAKLRFLSETLPWHVRYESFTGRLPTITAVNVGFVGVALEVFEIVLEETCLYTSTAESPLRAGFTINERGVVTAMRLDATTTIPLHGGSGFCRPETGFRYNGVGTASQLGGATALSIKLI